MIQDLPKIAALTIEIGGAPVTVTSDNRGLVRKWLTANGASYTSIANLPLGELSKLYNNERALASFLADQREEPEEPQPVTDHIPKSQPAPAPIKSTPQVMTSAHDAAAQLLALLTPKAQELDEKEVRRIAADEAGKVAGIRPTTCEIKAPHREAVEVGICHRNFPLLVKMIGAGCNVWLAGPAGTGKTTAAEKVAEALKLDFHFNGAIDSEHKLLGFTDAQGRIVSRPFREAFINGGVYLFDEVDASLPGALLAFNAALANGRCDFPDGCFPRHADFVCIAAANTWGQGATHDYVGRAKMDAAFIDRFVSLSWPTDEALERHLALTKIEDKSKGNQWVSFVQSVRAKVAASGIKIVISPRASIYGCQLLQAGLSREEVETATIKKGMAAESWNAIKG